MATVKAWKHGADGEPSYPDDFDIARKAVLQVTDIKTNRNKYYAIELHSAQVNGTTQFRVFTHYGRTDDLDTNPDSGQKECRYFDSHGEALANYESIYREKTSPKKGYKELALASSKIGSNKARGTSAGQIDDKTLERIAQQQAGAAEAPKPLESKLQKGVQDIVRYMYDEATTALTSTIAAKITANGIETPLGILTLGQIEKGEKILTDLYELFQKKKPERHRDKMVQLSGEFYTAIPHRIGRSRSAVEASVIDSLPAFDQKQDTLQLMKDMLQVNGESGNVLFNAHVDNEYQALGCDIEWIEPSSPEYKEMSEYVIKSQIKSKSIKVHSLYRLRRKHEWEAFRTDIGNERMLFHGSRIKNWVGILSRGILLPKIVVSLGVNRTDAGWLGNGIYFGDAACTSVFYTSPGKKKTRLLAIARVALGNMKDYTQITYGLNAPPDGYHSTHGVRHAGKVKSQFADDEYVIYDAAQQRLEYLVEIAA